DAGSTRLGARVDLQMRLADPARIRDHSQDLAILVGDHSRSLDSHTVQHAKKTGAEEGLPAFGLLLPEGFARDGARIGAGVAGVVPEDVDLAESCARFFKHRGYRRKTGHVPLRRNRFDAELFDFCGDGLSALEAEIVDDHAARIILGEAERNRAPHALSSAGHEADASFEI